MYGVVVISPLEVERRSAARAVGSLARLVRSGPGSQRIRETVRQESERGATVLILFGLAGGLRNDAQEGAASSVADEHGNTWKAKLAGSNGTGPRVLGLDRVVHDPAEKRLLGERDGADLVDCESHAFAAACEESGLTWAVVRVLSDGVNDSLPSGIEDWIDDRGKTKHWRVLPSLLARPLVIPKVCRLGRRSGMALKRGERVLRELIEGIQK